MAIHSLEASITGHPSCSSSPRLPIIHREVDGRRAGRSSNTEAPYYVRSNEIFERQDIATVTTRHRCGRRDGNGYSDTDSHPRSHHHSRKCRLTDSEFVNEGALPYREIVIGRVTKVTSPGSPTGPPWQQPDRGDEHSNVKSGPIDTRHQHGPCKDSVPGARDNIDQGGSARKAVSPGQLRGTDCRAACTHADGAGRLCGSSPIRTDGKRAAIDTSGGSRSIRSTRAKPARPNAAASV